MACPFECSERRRRARSVGSSDLRAHRHAAKARLVAQLGTELQVLSQLYIARSARSVDRPRLDT